MISKNCRNMLLDQLSKLQHAPSTQFQTMPATVEMPEEVNFCDIHSTPSLNILICCNIAETNLLSQREEDMEVRPKPRIWNGDHDYESDEDEIDKPMRSLNSDASYGENTDIR